MGIKFLVFSFFVIFKVSALADIESAPVWTHCANEYGVGSPRNCSYSGLRVMRFGNDESWVYAKHYEGLASYLCRKEQFPRVSLGSKPYRCEYSSKVVGELIDLPDNCADRHDCAGLSLTIPKGSPHTEGGVRNTGSQPNYNSDVGAFRTECKLSHFAYDDPLVHPNKPSAAHMHMFFGNKDVNAYTDLKKLRDSSESTCQGGTLNNSAYWVPALIDMNEKSFLAPEKTLWYYKEGYQGLAGQGFENLPPHLGMIGREFYWQCMNSTSQVGSIPSCPAGERLKLVVFFPQCWDGQNDWLADESHMANPSGGQCPTSHPHRLPRISLNIWWRMSYENQSDSLMLSSDMGGARGASAHADWVNGWDESISGAFITNCLNQSADCHANLLGDGRTLY